MDREKVIKGMEQFRADLKPFCGNHADWEKFDAGLSLLKAQDNEIDTLKTLLLGYETGAIKGNNVKGR